MKYLIIILVIIFSEQCFSQEILSVHFHADGIEKLASEEESIVINKLQFYISNIALVSENRKIAYKDSSHYLINVLDAKDKINLIVPGKLDYAYIQFDLGVDSIVNVSGAQGGDLDPIHGMYWTWQSGYINFKLEGISPLCKSRKNKFAYHLGGFDGDNNCLQTIVLPLKRKGDISVALDLHYLFQHLNLETSTKIMSPGVNAVVMSKKVTSSFKIVQ